MSRPRTALVTGAAAGIGFAIARRLSSDGFAVAINDIDDAGGRRACAQISEDGGQAIFVHGDVSDESAARSVVTGAAAGLGGLSALVNNAGIAVPGVIAGIDGSGWDRTLDVNLRSAVLCSRFALEHLAQAGGSIVNLASIAASHPTVSLGAYSASKAGIVALTQQCALEWGPLGVRVNAVAPGLIAGTGMTADAAADPAMTAAREEIVPLRREGRPADVAAVVSFLLGEDAAYVSGQTLGIDGGLSSALLNFIPRPPR